MNKLMNDQGAGRERYNHNEDETSSDKLLVKSPFISSRKTLARKLYYFRF